MLLAAQKLKRNDNFQFNYSAGVVVMHQCIPFGEGGLEIETQGFASK